MADDKERQSSNEVQQSQDEVWTDPDAHLTAAERSEIVSSLPAAR